MRCLPFFHDYQLESCYAFSDCYARKTRMLYVCQTCGKIRVETVDGAWVIKKGETEQVQEES